MRSLSSSPKQTGLLLMELEKLSLQRFDGESENWTSMPVPAEIRELKFLEYFDQGEEGKE